MNATTMTGEESEVIEAALRVRKTYSFGANRHAPDAEVTTYFGTPRCRVVRHDPVGTYPSVYQWVDDYNTAHGIAKLHALQMTAKYGGW